MDFLDFVKGLGADEDEKSESNIDDLGVEFGITPKELESYLKQYVISQDEAVEVIATKVATHYNRMRYEINNPDLPPIIGNVKNNILMIGPTGVGKTYIVKLIAQKMNVPFVKADATKFSETGYVGGDVEDLVRELVRKAKGNVQKAEYGIIYIDEIDKIASSKEIAGPDVSRGGVQRGLLKIMEETEVAIRSPYDIAGQMEELMMIQRGKRPTRRTINTKNILFIVSGAFNGLVDIIRKRIGRQKIGFLPEDKHGVDTDNNIDILKQVRTEDLIEYGFESEFVGRLPIVVVLNELDEDSLYRILANKNSAIVQSIKRDFASYGIEIDFDDDAYREIARIAIKEKTGARGLISILEKVVIPFERELPSTKIKHLKITKEVVHNPHKFINEIILKDAYDRIAADFRRNFQINLKFSSDLGQWLIDQARLKGKEVYEILRDVLRDFEYGLKLANINDFLVTKEVAMRNREYLEELIMKKRQSSETSHA